MKLKTFGKITEIISNNTEINLKFDNVGALKQYLEQNYPDLKSLPYVIAVDKQISTFEIPIYQNSEVALLPPFSGG